MSQQIFLHIAEPCHQDWNKMSPAQQGRFCDSCCKQVVDFSQMTDDEILHTLSKAAGKTCGRFTNEQLARPLTPQPAPLLPSYSYKYLYQLMITSVLSVSHAWAQQPKAPKPAAKTICTSEFKKGEPSFIKKDTGSKAAITLAIDKLKQQQQERRMMLGKVAYTSIQKKAITGIVVNEDGQPLANAQIFVTGSKLQLKLAADGSFSIPATAGNKVELKVVLKGYREQVLQASNQEEVQIVMQPELPVIMLGEVAVMPSLKAICKVIDEKGEPLPGATVSVKETDNSYAAGPDGIVNFDVSPRTKKVSLTASYNGNHSDTVAANITTGDTILIQLNTENILPDVVVTGYPNHTNNYSMVGGLTIVKRTTLRDTLQTVVVKAIGRAMFKVQPNPVQRGQQAQLLFKKEGEYTIIVFDNNGRLYQQQDISISSAKGAHHLSTSQLSAGTYFVKAIDNRNKKEFVDKLVIQ